MSPRDKVYSGILEPSTATKISIHAFPVYALLLQITFFALHNQTRCPGPGCPPLYDQDKRKSGIFLSFFPFVRYDYCVPSHKRDRQNRLPGIRFNYSPENAHFGARYWDM